MSIRSRCRSLLGAVAALAVSVSCGDGPTAPSPQEPVPDSFVQLAQEPVPDAFVRFQIVAPQEIAPQESVQLRVHAFRANGSFENITGQATWSVRSVAMLSVPSQPVLTVTPQGLATGGDRGRAMVTVRLGDQTLDATIVVVPEGTFSLMGKVTEGGAALEGVTVSVIAGIGQHLWTQTDSNGAYEIYGVAGPIQIRASMEGYADSVQASEVREHGALAFELRPRGPWENVAGTYTLVLAGEQCSGMLPQVRVYTARIEQTGAQLHVSLSGAQFWKDGDRFVGTVRPNGEVWFEIRPGSPWDYDAFDLAERLPGGGDLIVGGAITVRRTSAGLAGDMESRWDNGLYMRANAPTGICSVGRFELQQKK